MELVNNFLAWCDMTPTGFLIAFGGLAVIAVLFACLRPISNVARQVDEAEEQFDIEEQVHG